MSDQSKRASRPRLRLTGGDERFDPRVDLVGVLGLGNPGALLSLVPFFVEAQTLALVLDRWGVFDDLSTVRVMVDGAPIEVADRLTEGGVWR